MQAQKFMNDNRVKECWECDGIFFKREENARIRKADSGKEIIHHQASAGAKIEVKTDQQPQ